MTVTTTKSFDFHCHVDLFPDPAGLIQSCEQYEIFTLAVTTTPKAWSQNRKWTEGKRYVFPALGLHPELVGDRKSEIGLLEDLMEETRLVGEIGLDGSPRFRKSWDAQIEVFSRALTRANALGGRVVSIHSRWAENDVVALLDQNAMPDRVIPILHWYSGSQSAARRAVEYGCYFSVNLPMLSSKSGRKLIDVVPLDRLLTETDAPFTSVADRSCTPVDTVQIAKQLAALKQMPEGEFRDALSGNARRVLSFADIR